MRLLFVDIETTGFDRRWDSIIEVAAVLYNTDLKKEIITFHEYIKPYKKIPE
jgi:DNA polymerase III epsilon subunit-like protein